MVFFFISSFVHAAKPGQGKSREGLGAAQGRAGGPQPPKPEICSLEAPTGGFLGLAEGGQVQGVSRKNLLRYRAGGLGATVPMTVERRANILDRSAPSKVEGLKRRPPTEVGGLSLE